MRHKISKFSLIIFLLSSNFKLFGNPCDEFGCLCCCNDILMKKIIKEYQKQYGKEKINDLKTDCENYIQNAINNSNNLQTHDNNIDEKKEIKNYKFQTKGLRHFVKHYKTSNKVLPDYFFYILDILLKIPISNADLISIMKKELEYEEKQKQLEYIDIKNIKIVKNIEKWEDKKKRCILEEDNNNIPKDIDRTYSGLQYSTKNDNLKVLKKIIYNFISQLYKSGINIGYVQGMNFYAGFFQLLCQDTDMSGELAFQLLYLFMTKEWDVNDYITDTVITNEGDYQNPNNVEKKYTEAKYSIISFYIKEFLIIQSIANKLCDKITFGEDNSTKRKFFQPFTINLLVGLKILNIDMIRKIFFLILLVKNCRIFFDIVNFAVNVSSPPLNNDEEDILIYYDKEYFPNFVKQYTGKNVY